MWAEVLPRHDGDGEHLGYVQRDNQYSMGPWLLIHMQTYSLSRILLPARWYLMEPRVQVPSPFGSHQPSDRFGCLSGVLTRRKDGIPFYLEPTNSLFLLLTE